MVYQLFYGRFYQASTTFSIGSDTLTTTDGYYYMDGVAAAPTNFLGHLQTLIRAIGASQDTSTVTFDRSTRRVTITLETAATLSIANLKALLGYTDDSYGSGKTFTTERSPKYTWAPLRGMSWFPLENNGANFWVPKSFSPSGRSLDGTTFSIPKPILYSAEIEYFCLPKAEIITPVTGTIYEDFQNFFTSVVLSDNKFNFFPDSTKSTSSDVSNAAIGKDGEETIGSFTQYSTRHIRNYNGLWNLKIPMFKVV